MLTHARPSRSRACQRKPSRSGSNDWCPSQSIHLPPGARQIEPRTRNGLAGITTGWVGGSRDRCPSSQRAGRRVGDRSSRSFSNGAARAVRVDPPARHWCPDHRRRIGFWPPWCAHRRCDGPAWIRGHRSAGAGLTAASYNRMVVPMQVMPSADVSTACFGALADATRRDIVRRAIAGEEGVAELAGALPDELRGRAEARCDPRAGGAGHEAAHRAPQGRPDRTSTGFTSPGACSTSTRSCGAAESTA